MAHVAAVSFQCPACGKKFSAPATLSGRQLKCSGCGGGVMVPSPGAVGSRGAVSVAAVSRPSAVPPHAGPCAMKVPTVVWPRSDVGGTSAATRSQGQAKRPASGGGRWIWGAGVCVALASVALLAWSGGVKEWVARAVRATASVVPAVDVVVRGRTVRKSEVEDVLRRVRLNDISSSNVYQQMVCYSRGTMEMAGLVAVALGTDDEVTQRELRSAELAEIGTRTVHQQKAVYLKATFNLLAVGSRGAGVVASEVDSVCSGVRLNDIGTDTVHQQCANYANGCLKMAALLAKHEGGGAGEVAAALSDATLADIRADNVFQQIVGRLTGFVEVLGIAAKARGANVGGVMAEMRMADIGANTVYQQEVGRLTAALKLLGLVATGG